MFGDIVRGHRRKLGLSQQEVADRSGLSVRALRKLELGQVTTPRPVTVRLLAEVFGLVGPARDQFFAAVHAEPARAPGASRPPAQLPATIAGFVGRTGELGLLDAMVTADEQPTAAVIVTVSGTAGVGKTALAVHWAQRVRHRFPDGQLYVNLRGFDPAGTVMAPAEAIRRFLDGLAVPAERVPADPDAQVDLYRTLLADKRMLVVLDNARDADHVRPLLPGAPGCLVLVTSRNRLRSLVAAEGAHPLQLDLFTVDEARDMLTQRLGRARTAAAPDAVDEFVDRCARLPLALAIVAATAATQPGLPLAALANQLRDSGDRLDLLSTGDAPATDVRVVFSWSHQALSADSGRLFRLLGLHPGPDISTAAAASLAGQPVDYARSLLSDLGTVHLVSEHAPGRYVVHDLLRAWAAELAHTTESDVERHAASERALDHYLHTAHAAAQLLARDRDALTLTAPQPTVVVEQPAGSGEALDWFAAEHHVLLAAVAHAAAIGFDAHTLQLAWTLDTFLNWQGHWHDRVAIQHAAVAAALRLADRPAQARSCRRLAQAYARLGRLDDAYPHLQRALDLYGEVGHLAGQADTHLSLAYVAERRGRVAEALDHGGRALDLYRAAGERRGLANALNGIGWCYTLLDDHQQALAFCEQALTLLQELGDRDGQAATWDSLGYAHHHLGHHSHAVSCYQHAIVLRRGLGDRYYEADTLSHLGDTHRAADDPKAARDAWQHALDILTELGHSDADMVFAKLAALDTLPQDAS